MLIGLLRLIGVGAAVRSTPTSWIVVRRRSPTMFGVRARDEVAARFTERTGPAASLEPPDPGDDRLADLRCLHHIA
jgi:hypothetical protein